MRIFNFGSMNIDNVFRVDEFIKPGESKIVKGLSVCAGGKGLNQSIACAKAGMTTCHAGVVGSDGNMLRDVLAENGVKTEYIMEINAERTGFATIQIDDHGQNCILVYGGTNQMYTKEYIDAIFDQMDGEDIVLLQNETNLTDYVIEKAAARSIRVAINAAPYTDELHDMPLGDVTWLIVNEIEGASLVGMKDVLGLGTKDLDFSEVADELARKYPGVEIILTLGSEGSIYHGKSGRLFIPARKVEAVDTTAAGDTFIGFFLSSVAQGYNTEAALTIATAASSLAVQSEGAAQSIPTMTCAELAEL